MTSGLRGSKIAQARDATEDAGFQKVAARLRRAQIGKRMTFLESVGSTNDAACAEAEKGAPEGTVVVAEEQTAGRGRLRRRWHSPSGLGIWMSVVLRPEVGSETAPGMTLCASVAVAKAVRSLYPVDVSLKWPNDVMVKGKKLCGILTEMKASRRNVDFVVCGIGMNVNQTPEDFPVELREGAVSIMMATGKRVDRAELLAAMLEHLEEQYRKFCREGVASSLDEWRSMCPLFGKRVRIKGRREAVEGIFFNIDDNGALVLRLDSGIHRSFLAGDVELVS
jgi:BirA family transcriptional regulator, biotin operon repressor / biotin---[acetyl-CoA-carboxylase] ligase